MRAKTPIIAALVCAPAVAAPPAPLCHPSASPPRTVASWQARLAAGAAAQPPLTDSADGFAWPDTKLGVIRSGFGYSFFASDGGLHARQSWQGREVGNGKYGSITTTFGTLDAPLGITPPRDVSISRNPDASVNPNYDSYTYMGSGSVFQVPAGQKGAGSLLAVYHAELPQAALYPVLGMAASRDGGLHWTDLGEIVRFNQAFAPKLGGYEIGDSTLISSPDGKYFYVYFTDWIATGSKTPKTTNTLAVARAPMASVLAAAFGATRQYAVPFEKFYDLSWALQPGLGGASTDLIAQSPLQGQPDVHYDSALNRYVLLMSDDTSFAYAESVDGLIWTTPEIFGTYGGNPSIAAYPSAVGLGDDPRVLGRSFYVYFTLLPNDGTGWQHATVQRLTLSCP